MNSHPVTLRPHSAPSATSFALDAWSLGVVGLGALAAAPVLVVLSLALLPSDDIWAHLLATVLPRYLITTLLLALGVGVGVLGIGLGTAWLVARC